MIMYQVEIHDVEGLEKVMDVDKAWSMGELISSLLPVCGNKMNVTLTRKKEGSDGDE